MKRLNRTRYTRQTPSPVCGNCHKPINLSELLTRLSQGLRYEHDCGKVLVAGKTES